MSYSIEKRQDRQTMAKRQPFKPRDYNNHSNTNNKKADESFFLNDEKYNKSALGKYNRNNENKYDRSYDRNDKYERDNDKYEKTNEHKYQLKYEKGNENRYGNVECFNLERRSPSVIFQQENKNPLSFVQREDTHSNIKRENARRRGFDLRVNNIDNISDKITNLLSMVKKERKEQEKGFKQWETPLKKNIPQRSRLPRDYNVANFDKESADKTSIKQKRFAKEDSCFKATRSVSEFSNQRNHQKKFPKMIQKYDQNEEEYNYNYNKVSHFEEDYEITRKSYKQERSFYPQIEDKVNEQQIWERKRENWKTDRSAIDCMDETKLNEKDIERRVLEKRRQRQQKLEALKELSPYQKKSPQTIDFPFQERQRSYQKRKGREPKNCQKTQTSPFKGHGDLGRIDKINSTTKIVDEQIRQIKSKIEQSAKEKERTKDILGQFRDEEPGRLYSRNITPKSKPKQQNFELKLQPVEVSRVATIGLAEALGNQIEIDADLRSLRELFENLPDDSKWGNLKNQIHRKGVYISEKDLQETLRISSDQHNPFPTNRSQNLNHGVVKDLAEAFCKSEHNWEENVVQRGNFRELERQSFRPEDADLNQKGYLTIEDVVCFVNLYTGSFHRNRDVLMLYKRFLKAEDKQAITQGISYTTFMSTLCL